LNLERVLASRQIAEAFIERLCCHPRPDLVLGVRNFSYATIVCASRLTVSTVMPSSWPKVLAASAIKKTL
jgi:hypothetical protein